MKVAARGVVCKNVGDENDDWRGAARIPIPVVCLLPALQFIRSDRDLNRSALQYLFYSVIIVM